MSAPLSLIIPGTTVKVVNAYEATLDFAFVSLFRIVDLPTLGRPIRTTVASPPFRTSKEGPPLLLDCFSTSPRSLASFALRRPMWCSVCLLRLVIFFSYYYYIILSRTHITMTTYHTHTVLRISAIIPHP